MGGEFSGCIGVYGRKGSKILDIFDMVQIILLTKILKKSVIISLDNINQITPSKEGNQNDQGRNDCHDCQGRQNQQASGDGSP
jgi:hypothetical protein